MDDERKVRWVPIDYAAWAFRFQSEIGRAVSSEDGSCEDCNGYRVPVEQPDLSVNAEICEKCHREIPVGIDRHPRATLPAAAPKGRLGDNWKHENEIPEPLPQAIVDVPTNFDGNANFCISSGKDPPPAPTKTNLAYTSQRSPLFFVPDLTLQASRWRSGTRLKK
jgi:hypothetical protein